MRFVLAFSTLVVLLVTVGQAQARAQELETAVTGVSFDTGGELTQRIAVDDLSPGGARDVAVFLDGDGSSIARSAAVEVTDIEDLDRGCNRPELTAGDTSCGDADGGELSGWLELWVQPGTETQVDGRRACAAAASDPVGGLVGTLTAQTPAVVSLPDDTDADATLCLLARFRHDLRDDSDNLTQSDAVRFTVGLTLEGDLPTEVLPISEVADDGTDATTDDGTEVAGESFERTVAPSEVRAAGAVLPLGLPRTGGPFQLLLVLGAGLLVAGVTPLVLLARRRSTVTTTGGQP